MLVTSDIFELRRIGQYRDFRWSEHLLCGVDLHAPRWPGPERAAEFLMTAAKRCGLFEAMQYASYSRPNETRSRPIAPKSFEKLARGELRGAKDADGLLLEGRHPALGAQNACIGFGGSAAAVGAWGPDLPRPPNEHPPLRINFVFPVEDEPFQRASELLRLGIDLLDVEYGYVFVRDDLCGPLAYPWGMSAALDSSELARFDGKEVHEWSLYARRRIWSDARPLLRDLFQVNLLSARHLAEPIEGLGLLTDWIKTRPGRGQIEDLGQGRRLWSLSDQEMVDVRPALNAAGLLHSCRERIYRDLPNGFSPSERGWPQIMLFCREYRGP